MALIILPGGIVGTAGSRVGTIRADQPRDRDEAGGAKRRKVEAPRRTSGRGSG